MQIKNRGLVGVVGVLAMIAPMAGVLARPAPVTAARAPRAGRPAPVAAAAARPPLETATTSFEGRHRLTSTAASDWCSPPATFYPAFDPDPPYDVERYEIRIRVQPDQHFVHGNVLIEAVSRQAGLSRVDLNYCGPPILSVLESGQPRDFQLSGGILSVPLVAARATGQGFSIAVDYEGTIEPNRGIYFPGQNGTDTTATFTFSEPEDARAWFPCHDVPDDKAAVDLYVYVPPDYVVGSNGVLLQDSPTDDGLRLFRWQETHPIATYLISFAMARYMVLHDDRLPGIPITNYVYPADSAAAISTFEKVPEMIQYFSALFGPYDFDKYGHAEAPFPGGMEHQSLTTIGEFVVHQGDINQWVVAHELAHQWWGDAVTLRDWRHVWLNEGFASYGDALWFERLYGAPGRDERMKIFSDVFKLGAITRGLLHPLVNPPAEFAFGFTTYDKGAWVLHMLRHVVGDSAFFRTLREYHASFLYGNVVTDDFVAKAEAVHGSDLGWFFDPWLHGTGLPRYGLSWMSEPAGQGQVRVRVTVRQKQATPFYPMPVDFLIAGPGDSVRKTVFLDHNPQTFEVITSAAPSDSGVVLDPDNWILKTVDIEEFVPLPTGLALSRSRPNPFRESTSIEYALPDDGPVRLAVYDVAGRLVDVLVDRTEYAGAHQYTWDGTDAVGQATPSGIYFVRLEAAESGSRTQRLVRLR